MTEPAKEKVSLKESIARLESQLSVLEFQGNHRAIETTKKVILALKNKLKKEKSTR